MHHAGTGEGRASADGLGRVFIVGAGRVGIALARALVLSGHSPLGQWTQSPETAQNAAAVTQLPCAAGPLPIQIGAADTLILAISDQGLAATAGALLDAGLLAHARCVLHLGGARPAREALSPIADAVPVGTCHPLLSIADGMAGSKRLAQCFFAVEGDSEAVQQAQALVRALGARSVRVPSENMTLYHAAAVLASNHTVLLWSLAASLLDHHVLDADVARPVAAVEVLLPLIASTLDNALNQGLPQALTGPVRRGDAATVRRHLDVLGQTAPEFLEVYMACTRQAIALCAGMQQGGLSSEQAAALGAVLDAVPHSASASSGVAEPHRSGH